MSSVGPSPSHLHPRAADWVARLQSPECTPADRAAFEDWLAESPAHVEAWLQAERLHACAASLSGDDFLRAAARRARQGSASPARPRRWVQALSAMAAVLAVAVGIGALLPRGGEVHRTGLGEQRSFALQDGTQVVLDTDSELQVRFDRRQRHVALQRGRAQFEVGQDPRRPFLVQAGSSTIRDIGTTFQVTRRGDAVEVGLVEGIVEVSVPGGQLGVVQVVLAPGERVAVGADGALQPVMALDAEFAAAWPRGELVFRDRRLDQLLDEMNRYGDVRLRLADPALGAMRVSGVFRIDGQRALVAALERGWSLRTERRGDEILLHPPVAD